MGLLADAFLFACGLYLGVRSLAACYRVLDLWYTVRTAYPVMARGLAGWLGATALIGWWAGPHRLAFAAGMTACGLMHLVLYRLHRHLRPRTSVEATRVRGTSW